MRVIIILSVFSIGFLIGQQSIIFGYDPKNLETEGRILAANAYLLACVRGGKTNAQCMPEVDAWYRDSEPRLVSDGCEKRRCPL